MYKNSRPFEAALTETLQTMSAPPGHKFENGQVEQYKFEKSPYEETTQKPREQGWAKFGPNGNYGSRIGVLP